MGKRAIEQSSLWVAASELPTSPGHPFYTRLNALLERHDFDRFVEDLCRGFYAPVMGRPSLTPGRYFRLFLVGYFEGIDSERGIAWRATDSLAIRGFLRLAVDEPSPDHSTISRTRRLIDLDTHRAVFTWVQQRLVEEGLLTGKTNAIDATTLEANAAMRSIVRRDTGESYQAFLTGLAKTSGIETPTREDLARFTEGLTAEQLRASPHGFGSVGFHIRHIAGSVARPIPGGTVAVVDQMPEAFAAAIHDFLRGLGPAR